MAKATSLVARCVAAFLCACAVGMVPVAPVGERAFAQEASEPASGQNGEASQEDDAAATSPSVPGEAAFLAPLGRLASILGSMHFLRTLCGEADAGIWRDKIQELIDAQKPGEADRRKLVASFNAGYRGFAAVYRECTPAARTVINKYRQEGLDLAREIVTRYGN